jgi:hypothetical protein
VQEERWERLLAYAAHARSKPAFDREEVSYRVQVATELRQVLALAQRGEPWLAHLDKIFASKFDGRRFDLSPRAETTWFSRIASSAEQELGRELGLLLAAEDDLPKSFGRFARSVERVADTREHVNAVLDVGSVLMFACAPERCPIMRARALEELERGLDYSQFPETSVEETYEWHLDFLRQIRDRLRGAGIPVRHMLDVQCLTAIAARDQDFWIGGRRLWEWGQEPSDRVDAGKPYLSVCAIYRDEAPYLAEWIEFHRLVGVERFFLYDNMSSDEHLDVLAPYRESGTVVLHHWSVFPGQGLAYIDCIRWHRYDSQWIAFIDLDEFLFSPTGKKVSTLLRDYEQWPGVGVNWAGFGTSGHRTEPKGLVIENYLERLDTPRNQGIKSIVDPRRVLRPVNPHQFRYPYLGAVDENHFPIGESAVSKSVSFERLRINHYESKSEEHWLAKSRTKRAGGVPRPLKSERDLELKREDEKRYGRPDDAILRYVPRLRRALDEVL